MYSSGSAKDGQVDRSGGGSARGGLRSLKSGAPRGSTLSWSDGMIIVGEGVSAREGFTLTAKDGHGRGTRREVRTLRTDELGPPPGLKIELTASCASPVVAAVRQRIRVEIRSEDGNVPVAGGGGEAGGSGGRGTEAVESNITAGLATFEGLVGEVAF